MAIALKTMRTLKAASDDTLHSSSNRGIGSRMIPKAESCCRVSDYYRVGIVEEFEQDVKDPRQGRHRKHQERQHRPPVKERGPYEVMDRRPMDGADTTGSARSRPAAGASKMRRFLIDHAARPRRCRSA